MLDDPGGELLSNLIGTPVGLERFLRIAVRAAAALANVHQHGLIHKDIKPGNILVSTGSGEVRLTGFGIASRLTRERQAPDPPEGDYPGVDFYSVSRYIPFIDRESVMTAFKRPKPVHQMTVFAIRGDISR